MYRNDDNFNKILNDICKSKNIIIEDYSFGWIKKLIKDDKIRFILGESLEINSNVSSSIASDKYATYEVLKSFNIPVVEHRMVFNPKSDTRKYYYDEKLLNDAKRLLEENEFIVIKANNSFEGKDVYRASSLDETKEIIEKLFNSNNDSISICPFLDIDYEYRNIYLDGEIVFTYKKEKPYIIGDGINTIKNLEINYCQKYNVRCEFYKNLDIDYIPKKNEKIYLSWKHNLSAGGRPSLISVDDANVSYVQKIAKEAGDAINSRFMSVDVIHTTNNEIKILEINSSVCMKHLVDMIDNGYEIVKNIYLKAIDKMFE